MTDEYAFSRALFAFLVTANVGVVDESALRRAIKEYLRCYNVTDLSATAAEYNRMKEELDGKSKG